MTKSAVFENELNLIKDEKLRDFITECLEAAPDYFYTMPASTTGKYHPAYSLGEGGLVRHTKAAVKIANDLLSIEMYSKLAEHSDEIIAALIMHDSVKKGMDGEAYTTSDHPLQASKLIKEVANRKGVYDPQKIQFICSLVETHMGQWTKDFKTGVEVLDKPKTAEQKFVHQCDYLASRKYLTVDLED